MLSYMKKITILTILIVGVIFFGIMYNNNNPYKNTRTLPEIQEVDVSEVVVEYFLDDDHNSCYDGNLNQLISWFNNAKELKSDIGTTSDCRMTIFMKDGREIYIWNLYSYNWVTIGYRQGDSYYQTNVYSEELASYFMELRGSELEEALVIARMR